MGKADPFSPKGIANRIKSKGLQKLRWYCQLCQKQCRDENGFKCHQMSDGHRRQMELFGQNPGKVVAEYSRDFEREFLEHLRRAHPFSRVSAKIVYNEYIQDKHHVHMNSTRWLSLTSFVKYLGREGICKVDETEKGWFIMLIHKDAQEDIDEERKLKRSAAEKAEEERHMSAMQDQLERARKMARIGEAGTSSRVGDEVEGEGGHVLVREEEDKPIVLGLSLGIQRQALKVGEDKIVTSSWPQECSLPSTAEPGPGPKGGISQGLGPKISRVPTGRPVASVFQEDEEEEGRQGPSASNGVFLKGSHHTSKASELMLREMKEAKVSTRPAAPLPPPLSTTRNPHGHWLAPGIVVKILAPELKVHGYYKQKGVVMRLMDDRFVGEISMIESGDVIRVDQEQLETVLPSPGGIVLVVSGQYKGCEGELLSIDVSRFQAQVQLLNGEGKGRQVWLEYEECCKKA